MKVKFSIYSEIFVSAISVNVIRRRFFIRWFEHKIDCSTYCTNKYVYYDEIIAAMVSKLCIQNSYTKFRACVLYLYMSNLIAKVNLSNT